MGNELQPSHHHPRMHPQPTQNAKIKQPTQLKLFMPSFPEESPGAPVYQQPKSDVDNASAFEDVDDDINFIFCCKQILYCFWRSEIETLSVSQYQNTAVLFYTNVFQLLPEIPKLFNSKNIELQAKQFFGMLRWLITNLKSTDNQRWKRQIALLGALHRKAGIKAEWYSAFLQAFHQTMQQTVGDKYTARIQFNFEQLYMHVQSVMLQRDFVHIVSAETATWLSSIPSFIDCVEHKDAVAYLESFMREQLCVEWLLFYQDYRRFKQCETFADRQGIAKNIMETYVVMDAPRFINIRLDVRNQIFKSLSRSDNKFVFKIFDEFSNECQRMIQRNVWVLFKHCINAVAKNTTQNIECK